MNQRIEIDGHDCVYDVKGHGPCLTLLHSVGLSTREGWRYRGRLVTPGAPFIFYAGRYEVRGEVHSVTAGAPAGANP